MLTKNICTIAMIHSKVKQIRYKYRYGCNMTKAEKIEKKYMRMNTVPTKSFLMAGIFLSVFLLPI